ncbi:MAG: STAS domain-containing protein [Actinomycetota bacterium]|nr:STAS domain-containing protein [Actinomycetota bacterium]
MGWLRVNLQRRADGVAVVLTGELDLAEVGRVARRLAKVEQEAPPVVYVDLRKLTFLDSSGLQALVDVDARGRAAGRRVLFIRGPRTVQRVFEVTRLEERVEFLEDLPLE